ncbi:MAG TPA: glucose 1-dehydrogenase [Anaerolineae bacterium]|nr:glucose 1-dehydrogenase [Anaerolineae bacterium]
MGADSQLGGRVAVVTGGGTGIGQAIAVTLARAGADIAIADVNAEGAAGTAKLVEQEGRRALVIEADITQSDDVDRVVEATVEGLGGIDILVNNAGRSYMRPLLDFREDAWDAIFATNCKGPFLISRAVARKMIEQGGGRIINITTAGAERATAGMGMGPYHVSKAALKMLTMCMAAEWAEHNINVNAVGPGLTRTDFSKPIWDHPERAKAYLRGVPKGRVAEPQEIADAVLFLASDAADFITGHSLYVDGGYLSV